MSRPDIPQWQLERFLLQELPIEEMRELERRIADDPTAQARLEELRRSNQEILAAHPPAEVAAEIRRRLQGETRARQPAARPSFWWGGGLVAAAGMAAVMLLALQPSTPEDTIRTKGSAQLVVVRAGAQQAHLQNGDRARAGDVLQLGYRAPVGGYGAIYSVDGRGEVTVHFPNAPEAAPLRVDGLVELDHSFELDDAPGFERFVLITSPRPFPVADVQELVQRSHGLPRVEPPLAAQLLELRKVP